MKIALVSEHASPLATLGTRDAGGQNVFVAELATNLARRGHEITVHTRREEPGLPPRVALCDGVVVEHVDAGPAVHIDKDRLLPFMPAFADALVKRWTQRPPDVVHAHFWMSGWAAQQACDTIGLPLVQTFHALGSVKRRHLGADDPSPPERGFIERSLASCADAVIATCRDERAELMRLGANPGSVHIVPCGVDLSIFRAQPQRSPAPGRLLCVSRLVPRKGIADAIEATALLHDTELVVVGGPPREQLGEDPEHRRLTAIADRLSVAHRVTFTGGLPQPQIAALMRSSELLVALPWYEPFGIVPIEAMACDTPVVGTTVGGLLDTVVDGRTGRLVPPKRPDKVAEAIVDLLGDPRRLRRMSLAAARWASTEYPWTRVAAATEAVYRHASSPSRAWAKSS